MMEWTGERWWQAEVYRLKGALLLRQAIPAVAETGTYFRHALDIACRQQAKSLELRAATNLARLWKQESKHQEAYELLTLVYGWFTEGFDTADVQEAKELPEVLDSSTGRGRGVQ